MFVFDIATKVMLEETLDWVAQMIIGLFSQVFPLLNGMGLEILDQVWVKAIIALFFKLGWALFIVGIVVAVFECAIEYQSGRAGMKDLFLNIIKGFFAASLFTVLPIELYKMAVNSQSLFISGLGTLIDADDIGITIQDIMMVGIEEAGTIPGAPISPVQSLFIICIIIAYGYAVIKVFFANLKRGGILVIQIAVGSLHLFSIPRGYIDPFKSWAKTVIGLCLTAFLQTIVLTAGLMVFRSHMILGLGILLSAGEVPRICGQFGLDTGTKANIMGGVYAAQTVLNVSKSIAKAVA